MNPEFRDEPREQSLQYTDYHLPATAPPDVTQLSPSSDHNQSIGEAKTPEGDNSLTLERQPIYAQVKKKSEKDAEDSNNEPEGIKDTKGHAEMVATKNFNTIPKHRSRCVACGCPKVCCVRNFIFLWIVLFVLLQGGPLAVLIIDLMCIKSEGATIHKYVAEWNMQPAVCRVRGYFIEDFRSCTCLKSNQNCDALIKGLLHYRPQTKLREDYGCIKVMVDVYTYNQTGALHENIFIWKSEREYVLDTLKPNCFNLDICTIDNTKPWYEYRNDSKLDERILQDKNARGEGFVCHFKENEDGVPIIIMQMNTSSWSVLIWFILPLLGLLCCWLMIFFCLCWYCCPKQKKRSDDFSKEKPGEGADHEEGEGGGESRYLMPYND